MPGHHRNSFTDVIFFVVIVGVVLLALGLEPKHFSALAKSVMGLVR